MIRLVLDGGLKGIRSRRNKLDNFKGLVISSADQQSGIARPEKCKNVEKLIKNPQVKQRINQGFKKGKKVHEE